MLFRFQRNVFLTNVFEKYSDIKFHDISPIVIRGVTIRKIEKTEEIILEIMITFSRVFSLTFHETIGVCFN